MLYIIAMLSDVVYFIKKFFEDLSLERWIIFLY